jgi:hypothetical protein
MTIVAPGVVRILMEGEERHPNRVTLAGDVSDAAVNLALEKPDGQATLVSDEVTVRVDLDPFHVAFYGPDGTAVLDQNYEETNVADYTTVLPFGFSTVDGERPSTTPSPPSLMSTSTASARNSPTWTSAASS